jgi:eukaryotic-like serine/threonine-protein kinase
VTLASGSRLGPYEISGRLGEGGMGEVWRATDTRLDRDVAIKVLPAAFTEDRDRLARFEREARLLAQLHHPHIASIFGLEECDGVRALVMELVEGPTLAERLSSGPLSLEESLSTARQIAAALEEAHAKGIVHRDLKPQNIKAAADGTVKVLDFGLAKPMTPSAAESPSDIGLSPAIMNSPTITVRPGTELGIILGTAAYMAPEQARGGPLDKRCDIWAFGVVCFEMLTGRRLFAGDTASDTLAAVLKTEIDFFALPASTQPALRQLLRRCLERNPKNRLHDIADARIVLDDLIAGRPGEDFGLPAPAPSRRARWITAAWVTALVVGVAAATAFVALFASRPATQPPVPLRFSIMLAAGQELLYGANAIPVFSPDGGTLVFSGRMNGKPQLFRRDLSGREATAIPGTDGGDSAFFSPDGRWIGFASGGQLMKVASEGGRPFRLGGQQGLCGAWLRDGTIVFTPTYSDGLFQVPSEGGTRKRLTTPDKTKGELGHWWPELLPGERHIVFTAFRTPVDDSRIGVLDLATGNVRWLVEGGFFGRYVATGHLLYAREQRLYAVPFDAVTATVTGAAVAVLDDLLVSQTNAYGAFAVSSRGTLVYITDSLGNPLRELVWIDREGHTTPATGERRRFLSVSLSPDDRQAALTIHGESRDLWITSLERGTQSRLTSGGGTEFDPVWSHDGRELFYIFDRPPFELRRIAVDAPDTGRPIWNDPPTLDTTGAAVSPDGRTLAYELAADQTSRDLYSRPLDGSAPQHTIRAIRSEERNVSFSPDGGWIVYQSNETGRPEIYAQPFPGPGERVQVSTDGGTDPNWVRNGEIFYLHDNELRVVAARAKGRVEFAPPRSLFSFPITPSSMHEAQTYDVTRDGTRIITVAIPEASRPRQFEVVTDWTRELERLAPRGR